jgi:hypothetical protein
MFANGLAHRLGQHGYHLPTDVYKESAREVFQLLISEPSPRRPIQRAPDMQLVFRHDCLCVSHPCKAFPPPLLFPCEIAAAQVDFLGEVDEGKEVLLFFWFFPCLYCPSLLQKQLYSVHGSVCQVIDAVVDVCGSGLNGWCPRHSVLRVFWAPGLFTLLWFLPRGVSCSSFPCLLSKSAFQDIDLKIGRRT